jgi:hypothetical protein
VKEAPACAGASSPSFLVTEPSYGLGGGNALAELLIVRSDRSQRVVVDASNAFVSVGVNVADQETDFVASTDTVVWLFVVYGELLSVNVPSTVPVQLLLSYRVKTTVPAGAAAPDPVVIVAESCGNQLCAVEMAVVSLTRKHSVVLFVNSAGSS